MTYKEPHGDDCRRIIAKLYEFLDSELTDDKRTTVREHLDHCGPCLEAFEFEAELRAVIVSRARDPIPPHLLIRLAKLIEDEDASSIGRASE
ncbi:MAG: zf-HC2 domain-containing protein [Ferrimicrobium sp.]